jgi:hypothetical protein
MELKWFIGEEVLTNPPINQFTIEPVCVQYQSIVALSKPFSVTFQYFPPIS